MPHTDFTVQNIGDYLQGQGRGIDVLLTLDEIQKDDEYVQWKHAKTVMLNQGKSISDGTWRKRTHELYDLGMLEMEAIDRLKNRYRLNQQGRQVARLVSDLVRTLKTPA